MAKELIFNEEVWRKLESGIDKVTNAVKLTLGPRGRNVILSKKNSSPIITNDGVTIAKEIQLEDEFENMGAQLMIEVASKANEIAGDGTTTATILGQSIFKNGLKNIVSGANSIAIKRGIDKAVNLIINNISEISQKVQTKENISQVASISANNDEEIGLLISDAMEKVGQEGVITVEESKSIETTLDVVEGMQFDKGYLSPYMITDTNTKIANLENPFILVTDKKISNIKDLLPILEKTMQTGRPLLIIAEDVEGEALATLVVNKLRGTLNVTAVKAPSFGDNRKDILKDISIITGATYITDDLEMQLEKVELTDLGSAKIVKVGKDDTTIVEGSGNENSISERIKELKTQINNTESEFDKQKLKERLAKISTGVAVIYAGAATETELKEKKYRIEDALSATRAAVEEGIVTGGGCTLARFSETLKIMLEEEKLSEDEKIGVKIVQNALYEPLKQIVNNAGVSGEVVLNNILSSDKSNYGFDAAKLEYVDMFENGIVDPAKVTRSALQNAASISGMLLTTGCLIADKIDKDQKMIIQQPGMPGMM